MVRMVRVLRHIFIFQEVIELLYGFREVMRHSFETMDTDKIQQRWCCGDEPWLFRERWEKLFEDFCDVKQEKFDPSRVRLTILLLLLLSDTAPRFRSSMIPLSIVHFTTEHSSLLFLERNWNQSRVSTLKRSRFSHRNASFMSCTLVPKHCSTWLPHKNTELSHGKSKSRKSTSRDAY